MQENTLHIDTVIAQVPKHAGEVNGDVVEWDRDEHATLLLVCDGVGSGIRANIAATFCAARLKTLLREGFSLRQAVTEVAQTMEEAKHQAATYCAFTAARILTDGSMTALSYEIPSPLLCTPQHTVTLPARTLTSGKAMVVETRCRLQQDEALLIMSDGITQAGIGTRFHHAWGAEGVARFLSGLSTPHLSMDQFPEQVIQEALRLSEGGATDDMSVLLARCRTSSTLTILTGPPADPRNDLKVVRQFLNSRGKKIICGGTTSKIVSTILKEPILPDKTVDTLIAPPGYALKGIDLLTEGAMTLNQVYNILEIDPWNFDQDSSVTRLSLLLREADRILFIVGGSLNPASSHISYKQQGVLPRATIVPLLAAKLRTLGKHVSIELT